MLTIRALSDGKGYSARHLEHNDYYAEGERVVGQWFGCGAELLGLRGVVMTGDFEKFDEAMTERQARAFERGVPQARVIRWPHASHYLFITQERDVLREVTAFLGTLP